MNKQIIQALRELGVPAHLEGYEYIKMELELCLDKKSAINAMLSCVALNDTEHLGPVRIHRFADRLNELIKEFYGDREMGVIHLHSRLQQMGFQDEIESLERISGV